MKKILKKTLLVVYVGVGLIPFLVFSSSSFEPKEQCYNYSNNLLITQRNIQEAPAIFVLSALFANTENIYPVELWENQDNEQINIFDIAREIKSIAKVKDKVFNNIDDSSRAILLQRLTQMEDIADRALIMEADKWRAPYVNELMKHIIGIRHAGISDLISNVLDPNNCNETSSLNNLINPCNEKAKTWAQLSQHSIKNNDEVSSISDYMDEHGADIQQIKTWWDRQTKSSWSVMCLKLKVFFAHQRNLDPETSYWWRTDHKFANYPESWDEIKTNTFIIWHAYVQEVLARTKFYHNDQTNKRTCLIRTTSTRSLQSNGITHYGTEYTMPSAVYDSFSLFNIFGIDDSDFKAAAIIESSVPHHRIFHLYALLGEDYFTETEVIVLSGPDLSFDYFYSGSDDVSILRENLENGKGACKGVKLEGSVSPS